MLDFFGSEPNNTWEKSTNSTLCGLNTNVAPIDGITPHVVSNQPIAGGVSPEIKNIENLIGNADGSLILGKSAIAPQSREDLGLENYHSTSSIDALTGETRSNGTDGTISPIVDQAVRSANSYLSKLATDPDFNAKMNLAFSNSWNADVANTLVKAFAKGDFSGLPGIEILPSASINGANGAFASLTNTIYLAKEFVEQNAGNPGAITSVVLEETGHFIDSKVNVLDAAGDEGDIFARVVEGKAISAGELLGLKGEDDHVIVNFGGENIQIEQAKSFAAGDRVIDLIRQERGSWVDKTNDAEVFLSKGDWTFNQRTQLPNMDAMNGDFVNLIAGDFDGNGLTDFIRQEKGSWVNGVNDAQVYLGAGNGTFKSPIQMTDMGAMNGNFVNLVAGDFNGDKYTDIIRQEKGSWVDGFRDAEIYISNGNGTFKNPVLMNNASAMNGNFVNLIVGDFTGGGADDIIRQEKGSWVDGNNDVQYYTFSQGNFKFQANVPNMGAMNGNFVNLVAGDFNGDRVTDLIRQEKGSWVDNNRDAEICISNGNWGFKSITTMNNASGMNGDYVNLVTGDLTGGGADDIIRQEKGNWVNGVNDVEFLTYSNGNFVKKKDAPNMSELNGNYVTLVPGLFGMSSDTTLPSKPNDPLVANGSVQPGQVLKTVQTAWGTKNITAGAINAGKNVDAVLAAIRAFENGGKYGSNGGSTPGDTGAGKSIGAYQETYPQTYLPLGNSVMSTNLTVSQFYQGVPLAQDTAAIGRLKSYGLLDQIKNSNLYDEQQRWNIAQGIVNAWGSWFSDKDQTHSTPQQKYNYKLAHSQAILAAWSYT